MAAQPSFMYNQAFDYIAPEELDHVFLDSETAEKSASELEDLVQPFRSEKPAFVNDFAEDLPISWYEYGELPCSSPQDGPFRFESSGSHCNGDSTSLDPWVETSSMSFHTLPKLQTDNPPLNFLPNPRTAEWSMPWEEDLTDIPSSNSVPIALGNSYHSTPDLTKCSTPTSLSASNGPRVPTTGSLSSFDTETQRWHATLSRSRAADRYFLYGVLTTKIFCRPSCASRRPSRRHVVFFSFPGAIEAAEQAKFQPCKRCKPRTLGTRNTGVLAISQVLRSIIVQTFEKESEARKGDLKLETLAKSAGLSTFHFHRLFKATTQVTPADFIIACHALALQGILYTHPTRGTENRPSAVKLPPRWSERTARKALGGLSPKDFANGAKPTSVEYCYVSAPVGDLEVAYSRGQKTPNMTVHAILPLQEFGVPRGNHFWTSKGSEDHAQSLQQCVRELEEKCGDRDTELAADVLPVLWRARLWLKLTHDNG